MMTQRLSYIAIGAGLTLLIVLGTVMLALPAAKADEPTFSKQSDSNITNQSGAVLENIGDGSSSQLTTANSHSLAQRTVLIENWANSLTKNPGWLHTVVAYDFAEETHGTLPNGIKIPGDYILDNWKLLDAQGKVVSMINVMKDMDGNTIQFATYKDGYWNSFADGEKWAGDPPILPWQSLEEALPNIPDSVEQEEIVLENRTAIVFSTIETHTPVPLEETGGKLVSGHIIRETFDRETGQPIAVETIFTLENESEYFFSRYEYLTIETAKELPVDVNELLFQEIESITEEANQ